MLIGGYVCRIDGVEDQYGVLIKFDTQSFTDSFYMSFNGNRFSSLEVLDCFGSAEHFDLLPL